MIHKCHGISIAWAAFFLLAGCGASSTSVNLVNNGDGEASRIDSCPAGWKTIAGPWKLLEGDSARHDYGFAQNGKVYFFAGYCLQGILEQDVDVSAYPGQEFIFKGYERSLDQGMPSDKGMITLTTFNKSKTDSQLVYKSDTAMSIKTWQLLADTFRISPATAFVRIHLISVRFAGGDNDGYFDNISLVTNKHSDTLWFWIGLAVAIILVAAAIWVIRKQHPLR